MKLKTFDIIKNYLIIIFIIFCFIIFWRSFAYGQSCEWSRVKGTYIEAGDPSIGEAPVGKSNYWVDCDKTINGDGTFLNPYFGFTETCGWFNVDSFMQGKAKGGDYIYVKGNCAASKNIVGVRNMNCELARGEQGGTLTQMTTLKSWRGTTPAVFDGEGVMNKLINVRALNTSPNLGVKIQNIKCKRSIERCIAIDEEVVNSKILNVEAFDSKGDGSTGYAGGVSILSGTSHLYNVEVAYSKVYNNDLNPIPNDGNIGNISVLTDDGTLGGSVFYIHDNEISDNNGTSGGDGAIGIRHKHSGRGTFIERCNKFNNNQNDFLVRACQNKIENNVSYNSGQFIFMDRANLNCGSRTPDYTNPVGQDIEVSHNTIVDCTKGLLTAGYQTQSSEDKDLNIHDNLIVCPLNSGPFIVLGEFSGETFDITGSLFSYNLGNWGGDPINWLIHNTIKYSFNGAKAHLGDTTSQKSLNILFTNPTLRDYSLAPGSAGIGVGSNGSDVGAIPFVPQTTTTITTVTTTTNPSTTSSTTTTTTKTTTTTISKCKKALGDAVTYCH